MKQVRTFFRWAASQPWIRLASPLVSRVDRALYRRTGGRRTLVGLAGLPSLILSVRGRTSGIERMTPLLYVPDGDSYIITGSNWGGEKHPEWTTNLLARERAKVNIRGHIFDVRVHYLAGVQRREVWPIITKMWPAYNSYAARINRDLRIFRLEPATTDTESLPTDR